MKNALPQSLLLLTTLGVTACRSEPPHAVATPTTASADFLYDDLGTHHRAITTDSQPAQRYFDQGLILLWAFNHDEAIRSFREATKLDPTCVSAWWGIALANGPHINNPALDPEHAHAAWEALEIARGFTPGRSGIEVELVVALSKRYAAEPTEDRKALDQAYADAMREVWHAHPHDADVGTLFAEALMDLRPWDLWTLDGKPQPGTPEIVETLEAVLVLQPDHPGANHLYVHTMEASPHPEKALPSADRLRTLVPGAGHLVHMPGHIYLRLGRYADASAANEAAIETDRKHAALVPQDGFYHIYMAHNFGFLAYSAMMQGRRARSLEAAQAMVDGIPPEFIQAMGPLVDGYLPIVLHVQIRFGMWDEVLNQPEFPADLVISNAIRHYARGIAFAAQGNVDQAVRERNELAEIILKVDKQAMVGNSSALDVLAIAARMLAGEIAFRRGNSEESFELLREGVAIEDQLRYDEPPDWMMPVRHSLGAALMQAQKYDQAEVVFRADLERHPDNGYALFGLERCLVARGATEEARQTKARYDKAWAHADVQLKSSCFCQPGT